MNRALRTVRTSIVGLTALLSVQGIALVAAGPVAHAESQLNATTAVNVRSGPGTSYAIYGVLYSGDSVTATGPSNNGWTPVMFNGRAAYVASPYLSGDTAATRSGVATTDYLNVRTGAGTNYGVLSVLPPGTSVTVRGASQWGWTPISFRGQNAWVSSDYLTGLRGASAGTSAPANSVSTAGKSTTTDYLNVRTGPGTSYNVVTVLSPGTPVSPTGQSQGDWRQITYQGTDRWVSASYLSDGARAAAPAPSSPAPTVTPPSPTRSSSGTTCTASWYEDGAFTANGEAFNPNGLTAASLTLPFGTTLLITNPATGAAVKVRINDRGPYIGGRCLDLSRGAFQAIGNLDSGTVTVSYTQV